jgi:hypothetical protein
MSETYCGERWLLPQEAREMIQQRLSAPPARAFKTLNTAMVSGDVRLLIRVPGMDDNGDPVHFIYAGLTYEQLRYAVDREAILRHHIVNRLHEGIYYSEDDLLDWLAQTAPAGNKPIAAVTASKPGRKPASI